MVRPERVKEVINNLHVKVVSHTVDNLAPNRVLGARPPPIHLSEKSLNRESRSVLTQLRAGFCSRLNEFKVTLNIVLVRRTPDFVRTAALLPTQLTTSLSAIQTKQT